MDVKEPASAQISAQHRNPARVEEKGSQRNTAAQGRKSDVPGSFPQFSRHVPSAATNTVKKPFAPRDHAQPVTQQPAAASKAAVPATSSALDHSDAPSVSASDHVAVETAHQVPALLLDLFPTAPQNPITHPVK